MRNLVELRQVKGFPGKRDAILMLAFLLVATIGAWTALHQKTETDRPDWIGLRGTVVDKRLRFHEDYIHGSSAQGFLTIETETGSRVETRVPLSVYRDAKVGDWVEGNRGSLNFTPKMSAR